jgi:hypothetical protein
MRGHERVPLFFLKAVTWIKKMGLFRVGSYFFCGAKAGRSTSQNTLENSTA